MMWWAVWCAVVASGVVAAAAPSNEPLNSYIDLAQIDPPAPDDDGIAYAVAPSHIRNTLSAPWLYFFSDNPRDSQVSMGSHITRERRDFSVNPAVDALHDKLYQDGIKHLNRNLLNRIGKRERERSHEAENDITLHRVAHVGAASEAQLGEGTQGASSARRGQSELLERHRKKRLVLDGERRARPKRKMPSLSISNPMEVLRQRLIQEVARKQMREASQRQAMANRLFLQNVGKRGGWMSHDAALYDK